MVDQQIEAPPDYQAGALLAATIHGDLPTVQQWLGAGIDPNAARIVCGQLCPQGRPSSPLSSCSSRRAFASLRGTRARDDAAGQRGVGLSSAAAPTGRLEWFRGDASSCSCLARRRGRRRGRCPLVGRRTRCASSRPPDPSEPKSTSAPPKCNLQFGEKQNDFLL